ncbi:MAG TPA: VCBS repeat-containing protein, partial [Conexibacter sp.]|nr:VCBS repeat-containing protein [Conexibacter sp.]
AGRDDLAFTRMSGNDVGTLLSTGDGSFAAEPQLFGADMFFVAGMALADVDADGRNDLLVGGEGAVELFAGSGAAGGIATIPGGSIPTAGTSFDVALGDVTGDAQPDLVHTVEDTDTLTLVKNLNTAAASGTAAVDFGSAPAGGAAVERTVRLTSGGPGFYRVSSAAIAPAGSGVTIAADGCSGRPLAVGASCELTLRFAPGTAAGAVAATLTLADNTAAGSRAIPLTAAVTPLPGGGGGAGGGGAGGGGAGGGGGTPPAGGRDTTAPRLGALRLSPASFAVARGATAKVAGSARGRRAPKRGTTIRFTLSEAARVTLTVERRAAGRRSGRRCVAPTAKLRRARARACTRFVVAGTLVRGGGRQGANAVAFSGRIGRRALAAGRYRVTATAADAAGNRAAAIRAAFRVVRAR